MALASVRQQIAILVVSLLPVTKIASYIGAILVKPGLSVKRGSEIEFIE